MSAIGGGTGGASMAEEARRLVERAREQVGHGAIDAALADYDQALTLEPENVDALLGRAHANWQHGELAASTTDLSRALEVDAGNLEVRRLRGVVLEARGLYDEALADYEIVAREAPSADALRNLGDVHLAMGRIEQAEADYSQALELDSNFVPAYVGRGCARGRRNSYLAAIEDFTRAIELQPEYPRLQFLRGYTYGLLGDYEAALADLTVAIERAPDAEVYSRRADLHAAMGNAARAEDDLSAALALEPTQPELWLGRGQLLVSLARYREAIDDLTTAIGLDQGSLAAQRLRGIAYEALGKYDDALSDYDAVARCAPSPEAFANRADVLAATQNIAAAEADYSRALELDGSFVQARIGRARLRGGRGDYEAALEDLSAAIERDPTSREAHHLRSWAFQSLGRHHEALADLQLVVERAPSADACCDLGDVQMALDELAAARDAYARAIELDDRLERAYVGRGYANGRSGDLEPAHRDLTKALELAPDDLYARALLAMVLDGMNRLDDALAEYDRVLVDASPNAELLLRRGAVYESLGRAEDAQSDYRRATEIEPDNVAAYLQLGRLNAQMQHFDAAREAFDAAIALDPVNAPAHIGRGDAMAAIGECEQAVSDYDRAVEIDPQHVGALRARATAKQQLAVSFRERRLMRRMVESYIGAVSDLDQALELDPTDPRAYAEKAVVLRVLEGYDQAVQTATDGLHLAEGDDDAAVWLWGEKGDALQLWGHELSIPERLAEALEAFEAAAHKIQGPPPAWLHELTGRTLEGLDRRQEALRQFEQAIERDEASVTAHYALGRVLLALGEHRRALDVFGRLLELAGGLYFETMQAHVGQALAFRAVRDTDEAQRSLRAALGPGSVDDYVWRALCLHELGQGELGEAELRHAVELYPEAGLALNALAWHYTDRDPSPAHLIEALELAHRAVEHLDPEEAQYIAFDTLGWALFKLGRHDEAVHWLRRAVDVNPYQLALRQHLEQAQAARRAA